MQDNFPQETKSARKRRLASEFNAAAVKSTIKTVSDLTREERDELNALSKEVFGSKSKWQKLINQGYAKLLTEEVTEFVPGEKEEDEGTTRKVQVPTRRQDGARQSTTVRYTVESIKEYMLQRKEMIDNFKAQIKKQQEDAKAKKELEEQALKVHEELHGSAL
jgi:hypothetical protein